MAKYAILKHGIILYEGSIDDEPEVIIESDTVVEVVREYVAPSYDGGIACIIFDGLEAVSVSKNYLKFLEEENNNEEK